MKRALVLVNREGFDVLIEVFQTSLLNRSFLVSVLETVSEQFGLELEFIYFLRLLLNVFLPDLFDFFFFDFNAKKRMKDFPELCSV
jgi:hypothetical protein